MSDIEGLDESEWYDRNRSSDHWKGSYTRGSPKGRIEVAWNHVSPTQIENFIKCKRSWFFKSILKVPETQKGHQTLGEAFHLIMEKVPEGFSWPNRADVAASTEDWDKADAMAKQALPLLPSSIQIKREHGIRLETYEGGPTMVGYIDIAVPRGIGWPALLIPSNEAIVGDYKTLSDFRYMRTPQELADSVQMMTYAKWAIEPWPLGLQSKSLDESLLDLTDDNPVRLVHLYARTRPPFTRSSIRAESAIVTPSEINSRWNKTLDIVREMQQVSACTNHDDVEANGALNGHCEAYGGCHFRDKCGIAKSSGIKTLFQISKKPEVTEQNPMGSAILDKIRAAQAQVKAASATQSAATTPVAPAANVSAGPGTVENSATPVEPSNLVANPSNQPAGTVSKGPVSGLMIKIQGQGKGQPKLEGAIAAAYAKEYGFAAAQSFPGSGELGKHTVNTLGELMKIATGVVPPDAPARTQPVITRPGDAVVDPIKVLEPTGEELEDEEDGTGNTTSDSSSNVLSTGDTSTSDSTVTSVEQPKKRGRPSREEMAAREAAAKKAFDDAVNAEVTKRLGNVGQVSNAPIASNDVAGKLQAELAELASAMEGVENTNRKILEENETLLKDRNYYKNLADASTIGVAAIKEGFTLYVDCFPTKGDAPTDFFEWIGPICAQVAQQNSVGDWRQINYTAKGLLANAIRETIKEHGLPKALTVSTYAGGADIALEILTPLAKRVIKKI